MMVAVETRVRVLVCGRRPTMSQRNRPLKTASAVTVLFIYFLLLLLLDCPESVRMFSFSFNPTRHDFSAKNAHKKLSEANQKNGL